MGRLNPVSLPGEKESLNFPTVHFEGPEELGLPKRGRMIVEFEVVREVETETPKGHWYSCDIQLKRIESAEEEKDMRPSKRDTSTEDNLDRLMEEKEKEDY